MKNIYVYINPLYTLKKIITDAYFNKETNELNIKSWISIDPEYILFLHYYLNNEEKSIHHAINLRSILLSNKKIDFGFNVLKETHKKGYENNYYSIF